MNLLCKTAIFGILLSISALQMTSNIGKMAMVFSLLLILVSGFVTVFLLASSRGAINLPGQIIEFKSGSVPVVTFKTPEGKQMHFSDPLGSVPRGAKKGDTVTVVYVPRNGHARLTGTPLVELMIYGFLVLGIIGFIFSLVVILRNREVPHQGISGMYGR